MAEEFHIILDGRIVQIGGPLGAYETDLTHAQLQGNLYPGLMIFEDDSVSPSPLAGDTDSRRRGEGRQVDGGGGVTVSEAEDGQLTGRRVTLGSLSA
ncbi:MAG: hypothetical protein Q9226_003451 [Calogaya cf. arnoldii]